MVDTLWYDLTADLATAKSELSITDGDDDALINDYGLKANRKIDNRVFHLFDEIPELDTADITNELKQAAIFEIAKRYKNKIKSFESAKQYKEDFEDILKGVERRAKATPTERTRRRSTKTSFKNKQLFAQTKK